MKKKEDEIQGEMTKIQRFFASSYFNIMQFRESEGFNTFLKWANKFYRGILFIFLVIFFLSLGFLSMFYYGDDFYQTLYNNLYFLGTNILFVFLGALSLCLIYLRYFDKVIHFIFNYVLQWKVMFTFFILQSLQTTYNNLYLNYFLFEGIMGTFGAIIFLGIIFKWGIQVDKKDEKKGYYFGLYKKSYRKVMQSLEIKEQKQKADLSYSNAKEISFNHHVGIIEKLKIYFKIRRDLKKIFTANDYVREIEKIKRDIISNSKNLPNLEKEVEKIVEKKGEKGAANSDEFQKIKVGMKEFALKNRFNQKKFLKRTELFSKKMFLNFFLEELNTTKIIPNKIKPLSDEPIGIGNDIFGFTDFSKNIFDILNGIEFDNGKNGGFKNSFSIGIVGEWGGGKSSIINLLDEEYLDGNPNFVVHRFNPWNYEKENLLNRFFGDLSAILGDKSISKSLVKYLNLIGDVSNSGIVKSMTDFLSSFTGENTVEEVKANINSKLQNYGKKLVIIIDDLDRCEPDEVIIMLNLIKNLGDFNNIVYIVSYDKKHIVQVLEDKKFGAEYIDKIINIENFIPVPLNDEIKSYFIAQLKVILIKYSKNIKKIETEKIIDKLDLNKSDKAIEQYEKISTDMGTKFNKMFEQENMRLIKKLLNKLNIVFALNKTSSIELNSNSIEEIISLNYIKIKYNMDFLFLMNQRNYYGLENNKEVSYFKSEMPKELKSIIEGFYLSDWFIRYMGFEINKDGEFRVFIDSKGFNERKNRSEILQKYT